MERDHVDLDSFSSARIYASHGTAIARLDLTVGKNLSRFSCEPVYKSHREGIDDLSAAIADAFTEAGFHSAPPYAGAVSVAPASEPVSADGVLTVVRNLGRVLAILERRAPGRSTFKVEDEHDVRDLLHAMLLSRFDDVRIEEGVPSHAGASSRMDIHLRELQVAVEVKLAGKHATDRRIGDELLVDIERYRKHPSCKSLVCVVYDPERMLKNPQGLERDLSKDDDALAVKVVVVF